KYHYIRVFLGDCRPLVLQNRGQAVEVSLQIRVQKLLPGRSHRTTITHIWELKKPLSLEEKNRKPRMVVDYSQTINKYTLLDAITFACKIEVIENLQK
ncbi:hypothetical protein TNCV_2161741, partial [Trichonephila clavipes]